MLLPVDLASRLHYSSIEHLAPSFTIMSLD
jgi:hypothetical protein